MAQLKQVSGEWFVEAVEYMYIGQNPSFLVNCFIKAGITDRIGGNEQTDEKDNDDSDCTEYASSDDLAESNSDSELIDSD